MKKFLTLLILLISIYYLWSESGKGYEKLQYLKINSFESYSDSSNKGNIIGIQPFMESGDYATEGRFLQKIQFYLDQANQKNWLIPNRTIIVLPEYIGSWLVTIDEKTAIYESKKIEDGLTMMVKSNIFSFAKSYLTAPEVKDKIKYAVFTMKANRMAEVYQNIFSQLAHKYKVTIVAGSILLPNPKVIDGKLTVNKGDLFNISCIFRPDGQLDEQLVKKAFPVSDELPFVCPSKPEQTPVFDTPVGKMAVLVCADAWFSASYKAIKQKGAEFIVVPSYSSGSGYWNKSWTGYSGADTPKDAIADINKITLGQAWLKHAMGGRSKPEASIKKGMNVFLQGNLWDLGTDGTSIILNDSTFTTKHYGGSVLINLGL